jgi:hypothetical protein
MPVGTNAAQAGDGEQVASNAAEKEQNAGKPAEMQLSVAKSPKAKAKPAVKGTTKVKATATRNTRGPRTVKIHAKDKKRAEVKRAALKVNKRKSVPTTRPASSAEQGQ